VAHYIIKLKKEVKEHFMYETYIAFENIDYIQQLALKTDNLAIALKAEELKCKVTGLINVNVVNNTLIMDNNGHSKFDTNSLKEIKNKLENDTKNDLLASLEYEGENK
jgi:hypothetical protein